jgi:hypothetical protein
MTEQPMNFRYIRTVQKFLGCTPKEAIMYAKKYLRIVKDEMEGK